MDLFSSFPFPHCQLQCTQASAVLGDGSQMPYSQMLSNVEDDSHPVLAPPPRLSASALRHLLSGSLIKPSLITAVKVLRETSVLLQHAILICCPEVSINSGLEKVSFPSSLMLFLVVIGSQMQHHSKQRCLASVFHLQFHLK